MSDTSPLVIQAAIGSRALSAAGHDDFNQGQISCRRPGDSTFMIKGALTGFNEAAPDDFVRADLDPAQRPVTLAPPELPLHQAIYTARPEVAAIVHSHAPAGLVFGALDAELAPLSHEGALLAGSVHRFTDTSHTVLAMDVAAAIAETLDDGIAVFLVNHGSVIVGRSVRHAVVFALMLERACRLQLDALASGRSFSVSTPIDVDAKREYIFSDLSVRSYWEHTRRRVVREFPEAGQW
ncbi:class II aldolase/adducin family protein [Nocardia cyriacigeorgica]|uniref:Class II aldolase/adducin family protein n=1 Tax=Nocardia cyriacigeorgica TaxID=135487 RepID=A0A6P1CYZ4_9NOCA|nr:class II aldolase/adducin family protein [Nocardia cyriacigeorgica]NEW35465.1 class II aldolase/adducin family protein [Nocardia cyriacigeorgica]